MSIYRITRDGITRGFVERPGHNRPVWGGRGHDATFSERSEAIIAAVEDWQTHDLDAVRRWSWHIGLGVFHGLPVAREVLRDAVTWLAETGATVLEGGSAVATGMRRPESDEFVTARVLVLRTADRLAMLAPCENSVEKLPRFGGKNPEQVAGAPVPALWFDGDGCGPSAVEIAVSAWNIGKGLNVTACVRIPGAIDGALHLDSSGLRELARQCAELADWYDAQGGDA